MNKLAVYISIMNNSIFWKLPTTISKHNKQQHKYLGYEKIDIFITS